VPKSAIDSEPSSYALGSPLWRGGRAPCRSSPRSAPATFHWPPQVGVMRVLLNLALCLVATMVIASGTAAILFVVAQTTPKKVPVQQKTQIVGPRVQAWLDRKAEEQAYAEQGKGGCVGREGADGSASCRDSAANRAHSGGASAQRGAEPSCAARAGEASQTSREAGRKATTSSAARGNPRSLRLRSRSSLVFLS